MNTCSNVWDKDDYFGYQHKTFRSIVVTVRSHGGNNSTPFMVDGNTPFLFAVVRLNGPQNSVEILIPIYTGRFEKSCASESVGIE